MPRVVERVIPDVMYSVFRWMKEYQYQVGAVTAPITGHFADLILIPAYPDDLTKLEKPTIALGPADAEQTQAFISDASREDTYSIRWYGFVMGRGSDAKNRAYMDALMNDWKKLLEIAEDEGMTLYDAATQAVLGDMEMTGGRIRRLPVNALEIEAERFKFTAEAGVPID